MTNTLIPGTPVLLAGSHPAVGGIAYATPDRRVGAVWDGDSYRIAIPVPGYGTNYQTGWKRVQLTPIHKSIRIEGREYVGTAADGATVALGTLGEEDALRAYLAEHPAPDHW